MTNKIIIFDTTLRDGEQPNASRRLRSRKLDYIGQQVELGPDYIEAGFPFSSTQDFESVKEISRRYGNNNSTICALARVKKEDIAAAADALAPAKRSRIHVFIATSPNHMQNKLNMTEDQVLQAAIEGVKYARNFTDDVQFSPEDATSSEHGFLYRVLEAVIDAGATTVNIPDTIGRANPKQFGNLIKLIRKNVPNINRAVISVHCHNDLGLAVANSIAAIENGAGQVECTMHGIGERAGNASLEQIVANLLFKNKIAEKSGLVKPWEYGIKNELIAETSRLLSKILGFFPYPYAPIVGRNAWRHESGIHQHGFINDRETYEILRPEDFGYVAELILGSRSGVAGLEVRCKELGLNFSREQLREISLRFTDIAQEREVNGNAADDADIILAVKGEKQVPKHYTLAHYMPIHIPYRNSDGTVNDGEDYFEVRADVRMNETIRQSNASGDGQIDALTKAIQNAIERTDIEFRNFDSGAQGAGSEAMAGTMVDASKNGWKVESTAYDSDVVRSSADAYLVCADRIRYIERYFVERPG